MDTLSELNQNFYKVILNSKNNDSGSNNNSRSDDDITWRVHDYVFFLQIMLLCSLVRDFWIYNNSDQN